MGKKRLSYEYVKEQFKKEGYELISTEYINNKSKLELKCSKGHIFTSTYNDLCGCPTCYGRERLSYEYVKEQFKKEGYELISTEYINNKSKLIAKCPKGHVFDIIYGNFYSGYRCSYCYVRRKKTYNYIKDFIEKEGYELISTEYKNSGDKLKLKCPEGHTWNISYNSFHNGCRCPHCSHINGGSTPEKEVLKYVKELYKGEIKQNCRSIVKNYWTNRPLELDIFIPELNKALEYGAEYYHRNEYTKWKDMMKIKQCKKKGIELLLIDDNEWKNNKMECKNKIKSWMMGIC